MYKQQGILEVKKNERLYQMQLAPESPLGEVFDVLSEMRGFVVNKIMEEQKGKEVEDTPKGDE